MSRRPSSISVALVAALAATLVALVPSPASAATVTLAASSDRATYGDTVTLSGAVGGTGACAAGRTVRLRARAPGDAGSTVVGELAADPAGRFAFAVAPSVTARYRIVLLATPACSAETSNDVVVRVRARIDASVVVAGGEVGDCVDLSAIVSPPKPGQQVELQHRAAGHWSTVETVALNGDSVALARPCLGWDDIGIARFRVRWTSQDALNDTALSPTLAFEVTEARWMRRLDAIVGRRPISVSVGEGGSFLYRHLDQADRTPASNEKLLLAMTMLDTLGPGFRIETLASAERLDGAVVGGDLWLLGRGDPIVTKASLGRLAGAIVDAGIERVSGRVMGATNYFARDWDAPGWNRVARDYVNRPTALTYQGNHDDHPEEAAATVFTTLLERRGVAVRGRAGASAPPDGLTPVAALASKPLTTLLAKMLRPSWNFAAEVLGKRLGVETRGAPGTIAKGASAIERWARAHGAEDFTVFDNSGLSYANRVDAAGMVRLLWSAEASDWGDELRAALPTGGQGTLRERLRTVQVRAKTGTLSDVSALSGWVWADRLEAWVEFSILSDVGKPTATDIEDRIVRVISNHAG